MIQINEKAIQERETKRYAELVVMAANIRGMGHYGDMVNRRVPMNIMRAALKAATDVGVVDLDWTMARNVWGNRMRHKRMISERRAMYAAMRKQNFSFPEIAAAFGTRYTSIMYALRNANPAAKVAGEDLTAPRGRK